MVTSYPVSVRVGGAPHAFVIDASFALSPMGLLVTMALARVAIVWLPRGMLTLFDNDSIFRRDPSQMGGRWLPEEDRMDVLAAMAAELPAWQRAWQYGKLAARVHWIGDARYESAFADRDDASLLPRFEHCAAQLNGLLLTCDEIPVSPLDECARDAIALAAALQPDPVALITMTSDAGDRPPLCARLGTLGFSIRHRPAAALAGFAPLLEAATVPLEASGGQGALVQIVAPEVLTLPDSWDDPEWSIDDGTADDGHENFWRHACAMWQPLAPAEAAL